MIFPQIIKQMLKDNDNMSQYIPALKQNIIELVKTCDLCQKIKSNYLKDRI